MFTGITRTRDLDLTQEALDAWYSGELIQNAFPHLSSDDREFLISGVTTEEWKQYSHGE